MNVSTLPQAFRNAYQPDPDPDMLLSSAKLEKEWDSALEALNAQSASAPDDKVELDDEIAAWLASAKRQLAHAIQLQEKGRSAGAYFKLSQSAIVVQKQIRELEKRASRRVQVASTKAESSSDKRNRGPPSEEEDDDEEKACESCTAANAECEGDPGRGCARCRHKKIKCSKSSRQVKKRKLEVTVPVSAATTSTRKARRESPDCAQKSISAKKPARFLRDDESEVDDSEDEVDGIAAGEQDSTDKRSGPKQKQKQKAKPRPAAPPQKQSPSTQGKTKMKEAWIRELKDSIQALDIAGGYMLKGITEMQQAVGTLRAKLDKLADWDVEDNQENTE